jgi:hypothetical protein
MEFQKISIGNTVFGDVKKSSENYIHSYEGFPKVTNVDFRDMSLITKLKDPKDPMSE